MKKRTSKNKAKPVCLAQEPQIMIDLGLLERAEHGEYMTDGELHALHEQAGQLLLHYPDGPIPSARHAQAIGRILLVIVKSLLARIEELESAQTYGEAGVEREP